MLLRVSIAKAGESVSRCSEFAKAELTIGRRPTSDVILPDDGVSGSHARLVVTGRTLMLVDQGSTNGTFVRGERLAGPRALEAHEEVLISDYRLTFGLVEEEPRPSRRTEVPLSGALGWQEESAFPPPPPLLDELEPSPPSPPTPVRALSVHASVGSESIANFDPASPRSLHEQIFVAIWSRVAADVVAQAPGVEARVYGLLDHAISSASAIAELAAHTRETIAGEILGCAALEQVLEGEPEGVLMLGNEGVRVDRDGHVSVGPSPLSWATALVALGSRLCGVVLDEGTPVARGVCGRYSVDAVHGSRAGGVSTLGLRRIESSAGRGLDDLVPSPIHAQVLRAAVQAGVQIVLCVGPGAVARPVLGALLAAAPSTELQVVVAPAGMDGRCLRAGTVVLNRSRSGNTIGTALALGPTRLALEELSWGDIDGVDALLAASVRVIASVRASTPGLGLRRLASMLDGQEGAGVSAAAFVAGGVDLFVSVVASRDGTAKIDGLHEPAVSETGEVEFSPLIAHDPRSGISTPRFGSSPCLDELVHRGLLDPSVLAPVPLQEAT